MSEPLHSSTLSRWEHGSAIELGPVPKDANFSSTNHAVIRFGTARQAFVSLLGLLADERPMRRVLFPDVYCHTVTLAVRAHLQGRCEVATYPSTPGRTVELDCRDGDVIVVASTFGIMPEVLSSHDVVKIADTSHGVVRDSGKRISEFDYMIASLRKLHPVADGAVMEAPSGGSLPAQPRPSEQFEEFTLQLDRGLQRKAAYLSGAPLKKEAFLPAIRQYEAEFSRWTEPVDMSSRSRARWSAADPANAVAAAVANTRVVAVALASFRSSSPDPSAPSVRVGIGGTFISLTVSDGSEASPRGCLDPAEHLAGDPLADSPKRGCLTRFECVGWDHTRRQR